MDKKKTRHSYFEMTLLGTSFPGFIISEPIIKSPLPRVPVSPDPDSVA